MLQAVKCLDDNQAAEFATGSLATTEAATVEAHLAGCRDCRSLVAALAGASEESDVATMPRGAGHPGFNPTVPAHPGARGAATAAFAVGDRIGRYIVLGRLGQGGMGIVLSAYDPQLDRKVAIKVLRTGTGVAAGEGRARLIREAKSIAQLSHPNVVAVYDVGTADPGDVYIAMEFVEGDTLTAWQRRWDRSWREVLDVFLQAGRGLSAAHGAGLLHRDFKPDNVLVGADGRVRVGDFGLARTMVGPDDGRATPPVVAAALQGSLTATGTIVGTPRYMAPETFRGKDSDARSDQFSYCTALYEALFGRHPIDGDTAVAMVERGAAAMPPPEGHKLPASLVRAVLRGLEDQPSKRFPSMAALIAELTPPPVRAPRRMVLAIAAGVVVVGVATAAVISRGTDETPRREKDALVEQIKKKDQQIQELLDRLKRAESDAADKPVLVRQIEDLRKERDALLEIVQITAATEPPDLGTLPPEFVKRPKPDVAKRAVEALRAAPSVLAGCFSEWSERHPATDAHPTVTLRVSPDGTSHSLVARGVDDAVLPICVEDAIKQIKVPAPGMILELAVDIHYVGGAITSEARVTGGDAGAKSLDLDVGRPRQGPLIDR